jgi:hypothetical protein
MPFVSHPLLFANPPCAALACLVGSLVLLVAVCASRRELFAACSFVRAVIHASYLLDRALRDFLDSIGDPCEIT